MGLEAAAAVSAGTGLAGLGLQVAGGQRAADAAGKAAEAQAAEAARQRQAIMAQGQRGIDLAEATPQELANLDRQYQSASQNLDREQKLLNAIDPSLMEASQQALKLMRGESAGITGAMNAQRDLQRKQLVDQLRSAYGPGAETSSIGQKALQSFDMQTNMLTQQSNMSALNQVWGIANTDAGSRQRASLGQLMQAGQGYSDIQGRKINANNGMLAALAGQAPGMIQAAGAPYAQAALQGQGMSSIGAGLMGLAGTGLGYAMQAQNNTNLLDAIKQMRPGTSPTQPLPGGQTYDYSGAGPVAGGASGGQGLRGSAVPQFNGAGSLGYGAGYSNDPVSIGSIGMNLGRGYP